MLKTIWKPFSLVWRRQWHPTPVLLLGKSHGRRSLVGCSPWGRWESDTTEWLHFHFSPSCIGEGDGNPLQCSCLENPRDGGAWWAAIYGISQSRTRLKRLSSSSSSRIFLFFLISHLPFWFFKVLYFIISFLVCRTSFRQSSKINLIAANSFTFYSSETLDLPSFLEDNFASCVLQMIVVFLSFSELKKCYATSFWLPWFQRSNLLSSELFSHCR